MGAATLEHRTPGRVFSASDSGRWRLDDRLSPKDRSESRVRARHPGARPDRRLEPVVACGIGLFSLTGKVLLRFRVVVEGEHYLAWAVLLLVLGLLLVLVRAPSILR